MHGSFHPPCYFRWFIFCQIHSESLPLAGSSSWVTDAPAYIVQGHPNLHFTCCCCCCCCCWCPAKLLELIQARPGSQRNVWWFLQQVCMGHGMLLILLGKTLLNNCTLNIVSIYCRISLAYMLVGCFLCLAGGQMSTVVSDVIGKLQQVLQGCGGQLTPRCVCVPFSCCFPF